MAFVYILTNPCLDGWVKIGMTERDDIETRLRELNAPPNIPLSYRCYAVYKVNDPQLVEQHIHRIIDYVDNSLHAREILSNGRIREREFFRLSPETAYGIFYEIASLRYEQDCLTLYAPTQEQAEEEDIADSQTRRTNNSFNLLGIPVGCELKFLFDHSVTAYVASERNSVKYQGEVYSVSALALKLLVEKCGWQSSSRVNGWKYFVKDGITLNEMREQKERRSLEEAEL